jgi:hypothetical protein
VKAHTAHYRKHEAERKQSDCLDRKKARPADKIVLFFFIAHIHTEMRKQIR